MSTAPKTVTFDGVTYAVPDLAEQEYEVLTTLDPRGQDWSLVRLQAHTYTVDPSGTLEFWVVDDNDALHLIWALPKGWYGPWRVADREQPNTTLASPEVLAKLADGADERIREILSGVDAINEGDRSQQHSHVASDAVGAFQEAAETSPPKRLKDVWEGQGDPTPDGLGVVAKPHTEDSDPEAPVPEYDYQHWIDRQQAESEALLERLREQAGEQQTEEQENAALDWLKPSEDDEVVPQLVGLPKPPYTKDNIPYTTMIGSDGTTPQSDQGRVPDAVKIYAEKVAQEPDPYFTTTYPGGIPKTSYPRHLAADGAVSKSEIVEDWHGKAVDTRPPNG